MAIKRLQIKSLWIFLSRHFTMRCKVLNGAACVATGCLRLFFLVIEGNLDFWTIKMHGELQDLIVKIQILHTFVEIHISKTHAMRKQNSSSTKCCWAIASLKTSRFQIMNLLKLSWASSQIVWKIISQGVSWWFYFLQLLVFFGTCEISNVDFFNNFRKQTLDCKLRLWHVTIDHLPF